MAEEEDRTATGPAEATANAVDRIVRADVALLLAEFEALRHLIPGLSRSGHGTTSTDDAEIESNFDNMPV